MGLMAFRHGAFRFPHGAFCRLPWGFVLLLRRASLRANKSAAFRPRSPIPYYSITPQNHVITGGAIYLGHSQVIGVDFTIRFDFAQNNQRNIAGCNTRKSHPAIAEHRKVQHDNFAPCDSLVLHLATSRYRTLPLLPVAPCDSKRPILAPAPTLIVPMQTLCDSILHRT